MILIKNKKILITGIIFFVISLGLLSIYYLLISSPQEKSQKENEFTVAPRTSEAEIITNLKTGGFIKNSRVFNLILTLKNKHNKIEPGGYKIMNLNALKLADKLTNSPDMKWVTIPEGLRKEEIGEILAKTFNWSSSDLEKWTTIYTAMTDENLEGVYFPDTYLIPVKENGLDIAKRMTTRFNEKLAPYLDEFSKQDILWTTGLKVASIVQREAASSEDMPLIAGILWNRLTKGMKLEVDATVQYARGNKGSGWWAPIAPSDITDIDSPYNTYMYKGLPPHPICNPGIDAIKSVINSADSDCLYYLHDSNRQIHCAKTYEEHKANIEKYL